MKTPKPSRNTQPRGGAQKQKAESGDAAAIETKSSTAPAGSSQEPATTNEAPVRQVTAATGTVLIDEPSVGASQPKLIGGTAAAPAHEADASGLIPFALTLPLLPGSVPDDAVVFVRAKPARGRWRAGINFSREERSVPFADLGDDGLKALIEDPELAVAVRVPKPG